MKLERYEQNGLELLINLENGSVFGTQSAIARMAEKKPTDRSIRSFLGKYPSVIVEVQTTSGIRSCRVYDEDAIFDTLETFNPSLILQSAKCGLRVYLHQLAGFQVNSTALQPKDSTHELILRVLANQEEQANYFNAQIAEMRFEMQQQNEKLMLLLPDHEMMNSIREAIDDLENLKPILEAISQSLKDNPDQEKHPLKFYLLGKKCTRGLRIRIGQMVSGWLALSKGCKLDKLNGFQNRANLYPECALPLIILAWQLCTA